MIMNLDQNSFKEKGNQSKLNIVFSHNISGETHPCGCRQFPLGGLPQVHGLFTKLRQTSDLIYLDTGDTFFPSSVIPESMHRSLSFAGNNLALGLEKIGLDLLTPGDQDFAMGIDFLKQMAKERKFRFLISNLKDSSSLPSIDSAFYSQGNAKIYFLGLVDPETLNSPIANLFLSPKEALKNAIEKIKKSGFEPKNPYHRLIVLSHSGIDNDESLATIYPEIDWIIGSHSQSFLRYSKDVGNTKIVQTLSKNHYVGNISIDLIAPKDSDTYTLHEIREELEKADPNNPFGQFIASHKAKMSELQIEEQSKTALNHSTDTTALKIKTNETCVSCHKEQNNFWKKTPHSLAFLTLIKSKEENNLSCVGCHSLGLDLPGGFKNKTDITDVSPENRDQYFLELGKITDEIKSIRNLKPNEIEKVRTKIDLTDRKFSVKENFSHVQCLNCHQKDQGHPFESTAPRTGDERKRNIKNACLNCHTNDQSIHWYSKNSDGKAGPLDENIFNAALKKMSCPTSLNN